VLFACWSAKGGAGVSVTAAALAACRSRSAETLLVDLGGDQPALLGLADPAPLGLTDWLWAEAGVPADGLARLEVEVAPGWRLLPLGRCGGRVAGPQALARRHLLLDALLQEPRTVVVDLGRPLDGRVADDGPLTTLAVELAGGAARSLMVIRPSYLSLRRATQAPVRPSALIVLEEPGRALRGRDASEVLGVGVAATVPVDPAVARAVDAGLFVKRPPRAIDRSLRHVA
jgi:hypothetical protein